jgi:hypothetical protein
MYYYIWPSNQDAPEVYDTHCHYRPVHFIPPNSLIRQCETITRDQAAKLLWEHRHEAVRVG